MYIKGECVLEEDANSYSYVGGLIGYCDGVVMNGYSSGCKVEGYGEGNGYGNGYSYVGGLIGYCRQGRVTNSYSISCTIKGHGLGKSDGYGEGYSYVGGLVGFLENGAVMNSYSTNTRLTADGRFFDKGGICGRLDSETISSCLSNCYYLKDEDQEINKGLFGIGGTYADDEAETKAAVVSNFTGDIVLKGLNKLVDELGLETKIFEKNGEANENNREYLKLTFAELNYEITNKETLKKFKDAVNSGLFTLNAILKKDIEVINQKDNPTEYGYLQKLLEGTKTIYTLGSGEKTDLDELNWIPIGNNITPYMGTFDGNGHTINRLYCNVENIHVGLFGYVKNGTIKNLGIKNSFIRGSKNVSYMGGLIGVCDSGTVMNSYSGDCGVVCNEDPYCMVGGLIGCCSGGRVANSYSSGCTVKSDGYSDDVGGLIGVCDSGTVMNSYSTNTSLTGFYKGGICGELDLGTISNCYYLSFDDLGGIGCGSSTGAIVATVDEFKNGTVRDKLNIGAGREVFKQNNRLKSGSHRYLLLYWEKPESEVTLKIPVRVKINYDPSNNLE
ncbi:MAG: hypothetical protein J6C55_04145, partial [Oscillospiraceae bacterium]|nr:hypothetical protein [Oscillospiraceae bacterium]